VPSSVPTRISVISSRSSRRRSGRGAKANHLTYIGDAEIGAGANIGAGTITCNYDGFNKTLTRIGEGAFIGSNTVLVAPVSVGAGRPISRPAARLPTTVEADALAIGRGQQVDKPGRAKLIRKIEDGREAGRDRRRGKADVRQSSGSSARARVAPLLVDALRRLEYRGYDFGGDRDLDRRPHRASPAPEGKLDNLVARLAEKPVEGRIGIGHTRWATHGVPNETNAHPVGTDRVVIVH